MAQLVKCEGCHREFKDNQLYESFRVLGGSEGGRRQRRVSAQEAPQDKSEATPRPKPSPSSSTGSEGKGKA